MRYNKHIILLILIIICCSVIKGQIFFRIEADFSIKEKSSDGKQSLTMGRVYYDKNIKKLLYKINFPEPGMMIIYDTTIYQITNNRIVNKTSTLNLTDFSVYNLCLNGELPYYGLKNSPYKLTDIQKDSSMIITTWEIPPVINPGKGKLILSQVDKKLNGLVSFDPDNNILSKQFFRDYVNLNGLEFPTQVINYLYLNIDEDIKITTFKNIIFNNLEDEIYYNYPLSEF